MMNRLGSLLVTVFSFPAIALTGELLPVEQVIPQVCMVRFVSGELCSGSIIGKRMVALADHCGMMVNKHAKDRTIGRVHCRGEKRGKSFEFSEVAQMSAAFVTRVTGEKFENGALPRATDTSGADSSRYDVAVVHVNNDFETEALEIAKPEQMKQIVSEMWKPGGCQIFGIGLNQFGGFGQAHGVDAPIYRGANGVYNPILLEGASGVSPMDSGGPLVCTIDKKPTLIGVVSRGNGQVVSTTVEDLRHAKAISYFAFVGDPAVSAWLQSLTKLAQQSEASQ